MISFQIDTKIIEDPKPKDQIPKSMTQIYPERHRRCKTEASPGAKFVNPRSQIRNATLK